MGRGSTSGDFHLAKRSGTIIIDRKSPQLNVIEIS